MVSVKLLEWDKLIYCSEDTEMLREQKACSVKTECGQQLPSLLARRPGGEVDVLRAQEQCMVLWS